MRFKKVNVGKQLKKTNVIKPIFIPELNVAQKTKFNLILTDKSGQFSLNIPIRDSFGRIKTTKTVTFIPNQPLNLLGLFTQSDLIKSKEIQEAINKNILKYVEDDVDVLKPKPRVPYVDRISVPFEDRIKVEQETFGGTDSNGVNLATEPLSIIKDQSFFNFKIYATDPTYLLENTLDLNYTYSFLDDSGRALVKIPLSGSESILDTKVNYSTSELYSFKSSTPNIDEIGPTIKTHTPTDAYPHTKELWVYITYLPSNVYEHPVNDLGKTQKFVINTKLMRITIPKQYTITTTPVSPLTRHTGVGDA